MRSGACSWWELSCIMGNGGSILVFLLFRVVKPEYAAT